MSSVIRQQVVMCLAARCTAIGYVYIYDVHKENKNTEREHTCLNASLVDRLQREGGAGAGVRDSRMRRQYVHDPYVEAHQVHCSPDLRLRVSPQEVVTSREDGVELPYRVSQVLLPSPYPVTQPWGRI